MYYSQQRGDHVKKVLLMPFLRMPSGHHQVADALMEYIRQTDPSIVCEKADILSYSIGNLESVISGLYMKWIHWFPGTYSWVYKNMSLRSMDKEKRFYLYEFLFLTYMYRLILEKQPDLLICTHCLPSYIANRLKKLGLLSIPVINVYTDFFINNVWRIKETDFHFVSDRNMKEWLISRGVPEKRIFVTGIPVHPTFTHSNQAHIKPDSFITVLITGGSLGAGLLETFIKKTKPGGKVRYKVLCGKNKNLYDDLLRLNHPLITPLPYIQSKEEMNNLYNDIDVIVTKPGGVTISECIHKEIPILVYHTLPGQEEINLQHLKRLGVVLHWDDWNKGNIEDQVIDLVSDRQKLSWLKNNIMEYHRHITDNDLIAIFRKIIEYHS
jgi:UDP-N-acetylglucosamine:LPS N-acetylglucosamine transferase